MLQRHAMARPGAAEPLPSQDRCRSPVQDASSLRVPFALTAGRLVHVSKVTGRDDGPFTCPGCEARLVLREGQRKRRHFAHSAGEGCGGGPESGLHLYAKELLNRVRSIRIPPFEVEVAGRQRAAHAGGTFAFASAEIEARRDGYRPDLVLHAPIGSLIVEIKVHHAVDEAKRAKLVAAGVSAIEIDLKPLYRFDIALDELDRAILDTADRHWLANRRAAMHRRKVAARLRREEIDEADRLRAQLQRRPASPMDPDDVHAARTAVAAAGFSPLVGLRVPGDHWFTEEAAVWQAFVLKSYVIDRAMLHRTRPLIAEGSLPRGLARNDLPAYPQPRLLADAGLSADDFGSVAGAVTAYLAAVAARGGPVIKYPSGRFVIDPAVQDRLYRDFDLATTLAAILREADPPADAAALAAGWRSRALAASEPTPDELVTSGGPAFDALMRRLNALRVMAQPFSRSVNEDLCGLPLEAVLERKLAQKAGREARLAAEREAAATGRRQSLVDAAERGLGDEAAAWLGADVEPDVARADRAAASDAGLDEMWRELGHAERARRQRLAAEQAAAVARSQLEVAAIARLPSATHARVFLASAHPKLGGARPLDFCRDATSLARCLSLLPARR